MSSPELSDAIVAETVATLKSEGERYVEYPQLKTIAAQVVQLWDAIKSGDQARVDSVGRVLMLAANSLPVAESRWISGTKPIIDQMISRVPDRLRDRETLAGR